MARGELVRLCVQEDGERGRLLARAVVALERLPFWSLRRRVAELEAVDVGAVHTARATVSA